jgi:hypothetical protein
MGMHGERKQIEAGVSTLAMDLASRTEAQESVSYPLSERKLDLLELGFT